MDPHWLGEERSIALHRRIAELLREDARVLQRARAKVTAWREDRSVSRLYVAAWERLLALPEEELCAALVDPGERMRDLRQVTPFAGALSPQERWRIRREVLDRVHAEGKT